jgi:hypothetical protein
MMMKHSKGFLAVLVAALMLVTTVAFVQRQDIASQVDGVVTLGPAVSANSARTGTSVDIANYRGAMAFATSGVADNAVLDGYLVLQDSSPGVWAAVDSILTDSVDAKYYEIPYRGADRYLRVILRASGDAADSINFAATILRSGARSR